MAKFSKLPNFIDVSKWQLEIDFSKLPENIHGIIIKSSEGMTYQDPQFERNVTNAIPTGKYVGLYHYYRCASDPVFQATRLVNYYKAHPLLTIKPALDLEDAADLTTYPAYKLTLGENVRKFLFTVEDKLGIQPIIYTSTGFWNTYMMQFNLDLYAKYPLWLAQYGSAMPAATLPWTFPAIWQYSYKGKVMGITKKSTGTPTVDLNVVYDLDAILIPSNTINMPIVIK